MNPKDPRDEKGSKDLQKSTRPDTDKPEEGQDFQVQKKSLEVSEPPPRRCLGMGREIKAADTDAVDLSVEDLSIQTSDSLFQVLQDYDNKDENVRVRHRRQNETTKEQCPVREKIQELQPVDSQSKVRLSDSDLELLEEAAQPQPKPKPRKSSLYKLKAENLFKLADDFKGMKLDVEEDTSQRSPKRRRRKRSSVQKRVAAHDSEESTSQSLASQDQDMWPSNYEDKDDDSDEGPSTGSSWRRSPSKGENLSPLPVVSSQKGSRRGSGRGTGPSSYGASGSGSQETSRPSSSSRPSPGPHGASGSGSQGSSRPSSSSQGRSQSGSYGASGSGSYGSSESGSYGGSGSRSKGKSRPSSHGGCRPDSHPPSFDLDSSEWPSSFSYFSPPSSSWMSPRVSQHMQAELEAQEKRGQKKEAYCDTRQDVSDRWYSEMRNYDFKSPGFTPESGHFTAMIWKNTKKMGVGKAFATDGSSYVVARYFPAGNIVNPGFFEENVPRPAKK